MGLAIRDCEVGTIVDHALERDENDQLRQREIVRRGIIVKVTGNKQESIKDLFVKFKPDAEPENVKAVELNRVYASNHRIAKEAYRRIVGAPRHVGATFTVRKGVISQRVEDPMALSGSQKEGPIAPEFDDSADESGIGLADSQP